MQFGYFIQCYLTEVSKLKNKMIIVYSLIIAFLLSRITRYIATKTDNSVSRLEECVIFVFIWLPVSVWVLIVWEFIQCYLTKAT